MGPHIPGRARRVSEARVRLQPLLRLRRNAAEDDAQSPEAHVDRLGTSTVNSKILAGENALTIQHMIGAIFVSL